MLKTGQPIAPQKSPIYSEIGNRKSCNRISEITNASCGVTNRTSKISNLFGNRKSCNRRSEITNASCGVTNRTSKISNLFENRKSCNRISEIITVSRLLTITNPLFQGQPGGAPPLPPEQRSGVQTDFPAVLESFDTILLRWVTRIKIPFLKILLACPVPTRRYLGNLDFLGN